MGDPDRLGQPETAQPIRLPEQGKPIRGEREHAVDGAGDLDLPQRRDQLDRRLPGRDERLGVERVGGRRVIRRAVRTDVVGIDDHRLVTITADGVVVPPLAEVEILILMAQDRLPDLTGLTGKLGQRRGPRELVLTGTSGIGTPTMRPMRGPQMPQQTRTRSVSMRPLVVMTARTRPRSVSIPTTPVLAWNATPRVDRASSSAAQTGLATPSDGTKYAPRITESSTRWSLSLVPAGVSNEA